ncbi:CDP-alcohol phosphatidyltransferase [Tistlia consotensis USBA 355]|uniref:CDP-alcohol phosphatidyltransferase n=2 Tax=Tistlia TaxID=1321364 RepID=A0A1Y6BAQ0_9PROT|nr:CDP-alcohol phosphatidyltransferase [Tistlia consotensis USBA 355]
MHAVGGSTITPAMEQASAAMASDGSQAPRLVVDARPQALGALDPGHRLLGLSLLRRLVLAARRAGLSDCLVVAPAESRERLSALLAGLPSVAFAEQLPATAGGPTILLPADVLGETSWLSSLARTPVGPDERRSADGALLLGRAVAPAAASEVAAKPLALEPRPLRLGQPADLPGAERRLLQALRKQTDGFMARVFARPISIAVSRRLAPLGVTLNAMTLVSMLIGLAAAPFFLSAAPAWQVVGALLFVAHSVLDGCDGELARLTFHETRLGGLLDFASDNLVHVAVFACMALGWSAAAGSPWPLLAGLGAVAGTAGSAFSVYWLTLRRKAGSGPVYTSVSADGQPGRVTRLLDELSRRDFIYLVLAFAAFGKAQWFVALSGIGAPLFLLALLGAALGERRRRAAA